MGAKYSFNKKIGGNHVQGNSSQINWENETLNVWKEVAEEKQIFYCLTLGNRTWEKYEADEELFLKLKIGFSIFGPQEDKKEINDFSQYYGEPHQQIIINKITDIIINESKSKTVFIAFIFVVAWINQLEKYSEFPVFRLLKESKEGQEEISYFIDALGRLYKSWPEFLQKNVFPECIYCYPTNGYYSWTDKGEILLEFGQSPQSKLQNKVLSKVDTVSSAASVGSAFIGLASFAAPIAAPIILGAVATGFTASVWSTFRTATSIADRKKHGQSISLKDHEGRACWLSLAAGILGAASSGAVQYTQFLAKNNRVLTKLSSLAISGLEIGAISTVGLGVLNDLAAMVQNKELSKENCNDLILAVLFFCHCAISKKTAENVISDLQRTILPKIASQVSAGNSCPFKFIIEELAKNRNLTKPMSLLCINNKDSFLKDFLHVDYK